MRRRVAVGQVLALAAAALAHAQGADPLHSRECDAARAVLETALDDASHKTAGSAGRLADARKNAMAACLGREGGQRERSGVPEPAIVVPLPVMQVPRPPAQPAAVAPPAAPAYTPPPVVTTCDSTGCWDSNGQRINRLGPMLVGPRGACTEAGGTVRCP